MKIKNQFVSVARHDIESSKNMVYKQLQHSAFVKLCYKLFFNSENSLWKLCIIYSTALNKEQIPILVYILFYVTEFIVY